MRRYSVWSVLFLFIVVPPCFAQFSVDVGVDPEARKAIDDLRNALQQSLVTLADAIPGGRYTRLVEDLHGGDPEKRKAAQAFLRSLAGLDPTVDYDVSIWFDFDPKVRVRARAFRATLPTPDEIVARYKQANLTNAPEVSSTPLGGPAAEQVREEVRKAIEAAVNRIPHSTAIRPASAPVGSGGAEQYALAVAAADMAADERRAMVNDLARAFDAFYRKWPLPLQSGTISLPWPLFDDRQALFILIPEDDWKAHLGEIKVTALLHKKGDPKTNVPGLYPVTFEKDQWRRIGLRDAQQPPRDYMWAVTTMTDTLLISPVTARQLQDARDALAKWDNLRMKKTP